MYSYNITEEHQSGSDIFHQISLLSATNIGSCVSQKTEMDAIVIKIFNQFPNCNGDILFNYNIHIPNF